MNGLDRFFVQSNGTNNSKLFQEEIVKKMQKAAQVALAAFCRKAFGA